SAVRFITLALGLIGLAAAQPGVSWRKVGSSAVEMMLASPATGPVDRVWFAPDGSALYARTRSGKLFQTLDFETWTPAAAAIAEPAEAPSGQPRRVPEVGARVIATAVAPRLYSLGKQLLRSDDGGYSWINLTAFKSESVIGPGQHSVAV